jgi:hypothetical protein
MLLTPQQHPTLRFRGVATRGVSWATLSYVTPPPPSLYAAAVASCMGCSMEWTPQIIIKMNPKSLQMQSTSLPGPMQPPSDTCSIGSLVSIEGLQANPQLNGRTGVTLAFTEESGRWSVRIDASDKGPAVQKSIRPINLKVLPPSPLPSAPALHAESERNRLYKRCCECGAPATSL